jgi:uncharacterized membrane protein YbhN (UPF0104 family)
VLIAILVLIALFAPGLDEVRDLLANASPAWLIVAVVFEVMSGASYVLMFRGVFCPKMSWRTSWEISWSQLGVGSLVPASGIAGLTLGAWILHRDGMPGERIARRSVAFFLIKSSVNFVAVTVLGVAMFAGLGPHVSPALTILPAVLSALAMGAVALIPRFGPGTDPGPDASKPRRFWVATRRALITGTSEAIQIMREHDLRIMVGAFGYWVWDNAVLWAAFEAIGADVPLTVILMGYLIGQLGGLLPIPGGVGGIDLGLIGMLVVYGAPAAAVAAAVFAYRLILFWIPLVLGAIAFLSLQRALDRNQRADLCNPTANLSPVPAVRLSEAGNPVRDAG